MRSIALTVAMCMVAILLPTPAAAQAQIDQWTSSPQAKAHWNLAYQAMRAGDNVHAAEEFRLATQADPKFAEAYYYRGLVLVLHAFPNQQKTPPPAAAAESFQMYLALKPTGSLAVDSLSMLKELGSPPRSEERMPNANSTLAAKPQAAPQTTPLPATQTALAPPQPQAAMTQKPAPTQQSVPTQKPVPTQQPGSTQQPSPTQQSRATPQPLASQNKVETPREIAGPKAPSISVVSAAQTGASSPRASNPAPTTQNPPRVASAVSSSLAASSALPKPSNTPLAATAVPRPVAASTQCVRYQVTRSGQCGTPDEVEIRAWNPCAQPAAIQVCVEETSGHWNCAMSLHSHRRKAYTGVDGARQYVCHGTGRTRALSLPSGQDLPIFPPVSR